MDFLHFIGIDVSNNWFDVALDACAGKARRFDNTAEGIALFCAAFADHLKDGFVVVEATGGYETALIAAPRQAHSFSRSLGKQAKTDGLDAKALARFELPSQDQQCLNESMMRRVDLLAFQMAEKTRADHPRYARAMPPVRQSLADSRAFLASQITAIEAQIEALVAASPELRARSDIMTSQVGAGERTARILQAFLPELGCLTVPLPVSRVALLTQETAAPPANTDPSSAEEVPSNARSSPPPSAPERTIPTSATSSKDSSPKGNQKWSPSSQSCAKSSSA